jgi:DNA-binding response OmpR family regulator
MKILIASDKGEMVDIARKTLKEGGHEVDIATTEQLDKIEQKNYDFIMTDAGADEVLKNGNLEINTAEHTAKRNKRPIKMTPTEFRVIEYLIRRANKVVTKRELMDKCWGKNTKISPNAVEVYIKKLRSKLGSSLIRTVHGVGYTVSKK